MNADAFAVWLQGFLEAAKDASGTLSAEKVSMITSRLETVVARGPMRGGMNIQLPAA